MSRVIAGTLTVVTLLVIIVTALSVWRAGGEEEENYNSTAMETETEPLDLEFMTTTEEINFTATEAVIESLVNTATTSTAKVTRTPCRTKTGVLCKSWVGYFGQTISG